MDGAVGSGVGGKASPRLLNCLPWLAERLYRRRRCGLDGAGALRASKCDRAAARGGAETYQAAFCFALFRRRRK